MSVLGTSTQVSPGNYLFAATSVPGVPDVLGSPLILSHTGATAQIRPSEAANGTLLLGSSTAAYATLSVLETLGTTGSSGGIKVSALPSQGNYTGSLYADNILEGVALVCNGNNQVSLGSSAYPEIFSVSPVSGTNPGDSITANADINLGNVGGNGFNVNGYTLYRSAATACGAQSITAIADPAGMTDGTYLVMSLAGGAAGGISATCLRQGGSWSGGGGGAQVYSGGFSECINISGGALRIANYTDTAPSITLVYVRITSAAFFLHA